jgi:hypothetical protein
MKTILMIAALPCLPLVGCSVAPGDECDFDGDGDDAIACGGSDCDDADPITGHGFPEICDGLDNDCDGSLPDDRLYDPETGEHVGVDLSRNEYDHDGDGVPNCADCDFLPSYGCS